MIVRAHYQPCLPDAEQLGSVTAMWTERRGRRQTRQTVSIVLLDGIFLYEEIRDLPAPVVWAMADAVWRGRRGAAAD